MDNTINNISFGAKIKSITKIKDKPAFLEVKKLFEEQTPKDSEGVLYITDGVFGYNRLNLANSYNSVFTEGINNQLSTTSAAKIAEKLVKIFETLKSHAAAIEKNKQLESELNKAEALLSINKRIANSCKAEGRTTIAQRYNVLAERNKARIDAINKEIVNRLKRFNEKIDDLSTQYEEVSDLKFKIREM